MSGLIIDMIDPKEQLKNVYIMIKNTMNMISTVSSTAFNVEKGDVLIKEGALTKRVLEVLKKNGIIVESEEVINEIKKILKDDKNRLTFYIQFNVNDELYDVLKQIKMEIKK